MGNGWKRNSDISAEIQKIQRLKRNSALCSLREQLEILEILKSNGLNFAQFWSKFDYFNFGWCKTVKWLQDKYLEEIFFL